MCGRGPVFGTKLLLLIISCSDRFVNSIGKFDKLDDIIVNKVNKEHVNIVDLTNTLDTILPRATVETNVQTDFINILPCETHIMFICHYAAKVETRRRKHNLYT